MYYILYTCLHLCVNNDCEQTGDSLMSSSKSFI